MRRLQLFLLMSLSWMSLHASATTISFATVNLTGNLWQYEYTVTNDSLSTAIDEFTIYFDRDLFSNLAVEASPAGWDSIVVQPDSGIPADGFFDALALGQGLAPGATVTGFTVSFQFLGAGSPSAQPFEVVDPTSFSVIDSGATVAQATTGLPEPGSIALSAIGLSALAFARKRARRAGRE